MAKLITVGPKNCFFRSKLQSRSRCASRSDSSLTQSALLVAVPEAEPLVSTWRLKLDPVAARGVPAHITVLFPFLEPSEIDDDTVATLHELVSAHRRFNFDCVAVEFFDTDVMWLRPEPARGAKRRASSKR